MSNTHILNQFDLHRMIRAIFLILILCIGTISLGITLETGSSDIQENIVSENEFLMEKVSAGRQTDRLLEYEEREPIRINSNAEFAAMADLEGWPGDGHSFPYEISGYKIDGTGHGYGIYIGNTTVLFTIRDCWLHDATGDPSEYHWNSALVFYNVDDGGNHGLNMFRNILSHSTYGLYIESSENIIIQEHSIEHNGVHGANITDSNDIWLISSDIEHNAFDGVYLEQSIDCEIRQNLIHDNGQRGIRLLDSDVNYCSGNVISSSTYGIHLIRSHNNQIGSENLANDISACEDGIRLFQSFDNEIRNNVVHQNTFGMFIDGSSGNLLIHNGVINNNRGVRLDHSSENVIQGNTVDSNTFEGIRLDDSTDNVLYDNTVTSNRFGIYLLYDSDANTIRENGVSDNTNTGIFLRHTSDSNTIDDNTVNSNDNNGIRLSDSHTNNIEGNTVTYNGENGIYIHESDGNIISDNTVDFNGEDGIHLSDSDGNKLIENDIVDNGEEGIFMINSHHNDLLGNMLSDNRYQVDLDSSTNNTIEDNLVVDGYLGIRLRGSSDDNLISENTVERNTWGIYIRDSGSNVLSGNEFTEHTQDGIYLLNSDGNVIIDNDVEDNVIRGIRIEESEYNSVEDNSVRNNGFGIYLSDSDETDIEGNSLWGNHHGLYLLSSHGNMMVQNYVWSSTNSGIYLNESEYNLIENNHLWGNQYSVHLEVSLYNTISSNIMDSNDDGIHLAQGSNGNEISFNNIWGNSDIGIRLLSSSHNMVSYNTVLDNEDRGIFTDDAHWTTITRNTFSNSTIGIHLIDSAFVSVTGNTVSENGWYGIRVWNSDVEIYHNNFIDNGNQAYDNFDGNTWDNGYPSGGNYWSDHTGVDEYHGEGQDIPGSDGLGDSPYAIDGEGSEDGYPLMRPFTYVEIQCNEGWNFISFNIQLTGRGTAVGDILDEHVSGSYTRAMYYDASEDKWVSHVPERPERFNQDFSWDHTMGIWIHFDTADVITISGIEIDEVTLVLEPGWNMVSYPGQEAAQGGHPSEITIIGYFDGEAEYNLSYTVAFQTFTFEPFAGYWLYNTEDYAVEWIIDI